MTGNVEVKDWESQAKDITADVTSSDKYKSIALHAEVKLAEALERCTRVLPTAYTDDGEEKPNKLKTAVCCQVRHRPWLASAIVTCTAAQCWGAIRCIECHRMPIQGQVAADMPTHTQHTHTLVLHPAALGRVCGPVRPLQQCTQKHQR